MDRAQILHGLRRHPHCDVLIIGGGINGAGTFRDLALQGVDVLLVERGDFCSGASAASSHMAHGGIRYLENGEFRLVREAVQERNRMIRNAAHLVRPLPTTIPIFKIFSGLFNAPLKFLGWLDRPAERGALVIKMGLLLYDSYTRRQAVMPAHRFESRRQALARFPRLNPAVRYAATYYDGLILSPERLTLEVILNAEAGEPRARALNYVACEGTVEGKILLRDEPSGETLQISPKVIVNASGPWIDATNRSLGLQTHYIGGTKGSHIVLDNPDLRQAVGEHEFFFENKDGRIVLILPLADKVLVGTSDLPIADPDAARCTADEEDYFLGMIGRVFPGIGVDRSQIVFRFSGVRPLAFSTAKTAGQISRDHHIQEASLGKVPVYSLVGGKWTSYRLFSAQVTDKVLGFLNLPRTAGTQNLQIGGDWCYEEWQTAGADSDLFKRYGTRAESVRLYLTSGKDAPLKHKPDMSRREIGYLVEKEKVVHLDDLLLRRSMLALLGQLSRPLLEELAETTAELLDWDSSRRQAEVKRVVQILADRHGVEL